MDLHHGDSSNSNSSFLTSGLQLWRYGLEPVAFKWPLTSIPPVSTSWLIISLIALGLKYLEWFLIPTLKPVCFRDFTTGGFLVHSPPHPGGCAGELTLYPLGPGRLPGPSSKGPAREGTRPMIRAVVMMQETEDASATASLTQGILLIAWCSCIGLRTQCRTDCSANWNLP